MNVGVVGGGIVGLSAARFLSSRGHQVTIYERFPMFHEWGSSHGRTRIVRRAYPDEFYTACMSEAYPMWAELEAATSRKLVEECGLLYFGDRDARNVISMIDGLEANHVPYRIVASSEAQGLIPQVQLSNREIGVLTPEAGWVDAAGALRATYELAAAHGARFVQVHAMDLAQVEPAHDAVVVAAGAWVKSFVDVDVRVTKQTFGYVNAAVKGPVWIDDVSLTYGFPSDDWGQKIGAHLPGPEIDPNETDRSPDEAQLDQIREVARRRFGNSNPELSHIKTCLYTSTPDEDFRIGRIGDRSIFASACSGHGFKMGPWVGRLLADIVEGKDKPENHPRFAWPR